MAKKLRPSGPMFKEQYPGFMYIKKKIPKLKLVVMSDNLLAQVWKNKYEFYLPGNQNQE